MATRPPHHRLSLSTDLPAAAAAAAPAAPDAPAEERLLAQALVRHHEGLERAFEALRAGGDDGDPVALRLSWGRLEQELREHMRLEEEEMLTAFARSHPRAAAELRAEHDTIRSALLVIGATLGLRPVRAALVGELVTRLRGHTRREERLLYPWAERHLPAERWRSLAAERRASAHATSA